ncbi:hypothetical protein A3D03_00500 [Candidatus Gottesmanbacteria bacterium RIFCSPHIGHO2_02_FULL_40_13]|uniref:Nicotinamide mononucleotide transporter PnuC n=1 Tax=Candidatus Gottesmanbacteria bacterium RIFCSPHIGHO2_02_FULL_40_13 TaxID=1798384 RepID=A0A1F6A612_9BACT|nr:MAG: hypothetical protein A3D03_00500 [Candidatus Gottesmanbacteria bacterium RIFCSPHIGHO2_02_FULL_40_13]
MTQLIAQIIGIVALLFVLLSFQKNSRYLILLFLIIVQILFTLHFGLLGAWTGAAMNGVAAFRTYIFNQRETKIWSNNPFWLYLFVVLFWVFGIVTWSGYYSILPILAMTIDSFAVWNKKTQYIRRLMLIPRPLWFIYNYTVVSYAGMITEIFVLFSILIGIIRFDLVTTMKKQNRF